MRLIEKVWFNGHNAKWLVVPLLLPLTLLFALLSMLRRFFYRTGVFTSVRVNKPVIVVGNIGVGGNGKTPVVIFLIAQCKKLGLTPGVISRGYGGNAPYYPYLLNDQSTAVESGDEPLLIYQRCHVPVAVGADRIASAQLLISQGCNIIIADDGLQHYRLARELELIVIDDKRRFGNGLLLPAGPLREGQWRLKQADFLVINKMSQINKTQTTEDVSVFVSEKTPVLTMTLQPSIVCNVLSGEQITLAVFIQTHQQVNAIAGIGDPQRFFNTLNQQGFILNHQQGFVDHHHFNENDFVTFKHDIPLLMTEKDVVKCQKFAKENWWYVPVDAEFSARDKKTLASKISQLID